MHLTLKASLWASSFGQQDRLDALERTGAEVPVVLLVPGGGAREHDVVAVVAAGNASLVVLGIVLKRKKISFK